MTGSGLCRAGHVVKTIAAAASDDRVARDVESAIGVIESAAGGLNAGGVAVADEQRVLVPSGLRVERAAVEIVGAGGAATADVDEAGGGDGREGVLRERADRSDAGADEDPVIVGDAVEKDGGRRFGAGDGVAAVGGVAGCQAGVADPEALPRRLGAGGEVRLTVPPFWTTVPVPPPLGVGGLVGVTRSGIASNPPTRISPRSIVPPLMVR